MININKKIIVVCVVAVCLLFVTGWLSFNYGKNYAFRQIPYMDLSGSVNISSDLQNKIIELANKYIKENSVEDMEYLLQVDRITAGKPEQEVFVIFNVTPFDSGIDSVKIVIQIKNNIPEVIGFGSALPGVWENYPQLRGII